VHHSIIHIKNPTRCSSVSKFYFIFIWSSTCFGWHTTHHQEPKTALAASGFAYAEGCWPCSCWMLTASYKYKIKFWYTAASCWIFYVNYNMRNLLFWEFQCPMKWNQSSPLNRMSVSSALHPKNIAIHKLQSCFINVVPEFSNHSCLMLMVMQQMYCISCWWCKKTCWLCQLGQ